MGIKEKSLFKTFNANVSISTLDDNGHDKERHSLPI